MSTLMMKSYSTIFISVLIIQAIKSQIICAPDSDCIIGCGSYNITCRDSTIDATEATSLTVL